MKIKNKIKVVFILPSLVAGGAERVISFIAQNINKEKFEPTLLIAGNKEKCSYDVSNVTVIYLNKSRILTALPAILLHIYQIEPDIVISSVSHLNKAMSAISRFFTKTKFIGRESTVLSKRKNEKKKRKWSPFHILPLEIKNLDMIVCQSEDMAEDIIRNYQVPQDKLCIINNPISQEIPVKDFIPTRNVKKFITVGRLNEVKGHLRILDVLSKFEGSFEYTIIGNGDLKKEIFRKAKSLGLHNHIKHIPFTKNVSEHLAQNDFFLQGSYVEGFPNALLESCVVGTPVIAFDVPGGTKEIVINGVNGFLVDDENEFLIRLLDNREWSPSEISKSVYEKFSKDKIIKQYENLFFEILK